ncbi:MAG: tetratricopeptide repeat protein [Thermodesulfobacteriota bacterium]
MFTDIAGYTLLMEKDEHQAMELLKKNRHVQMPIIKRYNGEWLKEIGDGTLSSFPSAIDAVNCGVEIQRVLKWDPQHNLRIGIHVGDVVFKKGDVFGAGVNVASRLEPLAEPGGICVSERVYDDIKNKPKIKTAFLGEKTLKNVDRPVKVYALVGEGLAVPEQVQVTEKVVDRESEELPTEEKEIPTWRLKRKLLTLSPLLVGGIIVVILALVLYPLVVPDKVDLAMEKGVSLKSIAVLPFTAFTKSEEDESFAAGIHDDILTQLAKIRDLKVISRTSVVRYKETQKSMREIGAELSVGSILEGSVRRAGDRIRITAQLVRADTDEHLWAEAYDRDYADIFAIQSDVAQKIATALKAVLKPKEKKYIERKPTENMEAYNYHLRGNSYVFRGNIEKYLQSAIQFYEKAVDLDQDFALAYARLSTAHIKMYWHGFDHTANRLQMAETVLNRAIELDPRIPDVHLAKGYYYYYGFRDFDNALEEFLIAERDQPNNSDLLAAIGYVQRRQGKWEKSTRNLRMSAELDPHSALKSAGVAVNYIYLRNWPEASRFAERAINVDPENPIGYSWKGYIILASEGDVEKTRLLIAESEGTVDPDDFVFERFFTEGLGRDYQKALNIIEGDTKNWYLEKADMHRLLGQTKMALTYYDSARIQYENEIRENPEYDEAHYRVGMAYAGLGRKEDAIREGKLALDLVPISKDALTGPVNVQNLALIYTSVGKYDLAMEQIEYLLSIPSFVTISLLELDPRWDPLRDHPRFQRLLEGGE